MSFRQLKIGKSLTNRHESDSLDKYLREINRIPLISPEEEASLASAIKRGDEAALNKLVKANLRFVVSVAKQFQSQGLSLSDLINEGNYGLMKAARNFDETKGFKFISYAIWWIRQSMILAIAEQGKMVRIPYNRFTSDKKVFRAASVLEQQLERQPSAEEIADILQMSADEVTNTLESDRRHVCIDAPLFEGEEGTMIDTLENKEVDSTDKKLHYKESLKIEIDRSLNSLPSVQKNVLCYFFGIGIDRPLPLEEIGVHMKLSRERIRQIKDKAISNLREKNQRNLLQSFIGQA